MGSLHFRSAFVAIFTLPVGILMAFMAMYPFGVNANIMSLSDIAIAIGVMVDASMVLVENAHKHLEKNRLKEDQDKKSHTEIIIAASKEVGPALFYSLLIITVSFLPVFTLEEQSGRLFKPLAYTKTFAMASSSILAITIIPVLMTFFIRETPINPEMPKADKLKIWIPSIAGSPLIVIALGIAGMKLPEWSLTGAIILSVFIFLCLVPQKIMPEAKNPISRFF